MSSRPRGGDRRRHPRSKYARYHTSHEGDVWFPSEVDFRHEPTNRLALDPSRVVRVEGAEFNLVLPPLTFERRGVEQSAATNAASQAFLTGAVSPQRAKIAPRAGQPRATYAPSPNAAPTHHPAGLRPAAARRAGWPGRWPDSVRGRGRPAAGGPRQPPPVPTAEELRKIEEQILENRRRIRAGRLEVDQYSMLGDDPRALQVASHDLYDFKGGKVTEEHGLGVEEENLSGPHPDPAGADGRRWRGDRAGFRGGRAAPPADFNSRFMGFSSVGPSLVELLARPDRRNQKIVAAVEDGEPVLKVSFQVGDEQSDEVEYWLAPASVTCRSIPGGRSTSERTEASATRPS